MVRKTATYVARVGAVFETELIAKHGTTLLSLCQYLNCIHILFVQNSERDSTALEIYQLDFVNFFE